MTAPADPGARSPRATRVIALGVAALAAVLVLGYLRDPPWLQHTTSGLRNWQTASDGTRFRWAGAHASFFVPADAGHVRLPLRTTFNRPGEWPIAVSITVDDRPAGRVVLADAAWHESLIRLPGPGGRRVRRIDVRSDRAREDNHAVQVGEITLGAAPK